VDVQLQVGPVRKVLRVLGNRYWSYDGSEMASSAPEPFDRMPIRYEGAFGGTSHSAGPKAAITDDRNPVGVGYLASAERYAHQRLPNIEEPGALIHDWRARPRPAGFGSICSSWSPRKELAGTFDAEWLRNRCPLWPEDYDARHQRSAPPDLVSETPLRGG